MIPDSSAILSRPRKSESTPIRPSAISAAVLAKSSAAAAMALSLTKRTGSKTTPRHRAAPSLGGRAAGGVNSASRPCSSSSREAGDLGDRRERLGKLGAGVEAELASLVRLQQVAGVARRRGLRRAVEARVLPRVDPDLHRHPAGGGVVARGKASATGSGCPLRYGRRERSRTSLPSAKRKLEMIRPAQM